MCAVSDARRIDAGGSVTPIPETLVAPTDRRGHGLAAIGNWLIAFLDEKRQGLSLTRGLAVACAWAVIDLAHDWLAICGKDLGKVMVGWAFVAFTLGGLLLAAILALGAKHIDRLLDVIAAIANRRFNPAPDTAPSSPSTPDPRP